MSDYTKIRQAKTPPHATMRGLRKASNMTLDQVAAAVNEILGQKAKVNRGTISAIESGLRGASTQMLNAIAVAYGMEPGDLVTNYEPRKLERDLAEDVVA